jgi:hypothetical protein
VYKALLLPLESHSRQRHAAAVAARAQPDNTVASPAALPDAASTPAAASTPVKQPDTPSDDSLKRKAAPEEADQKRARVKTG